MNEGFEADSRSIAERLYAAWLQRAEPDPSRDFEAFCAAHPEQAADLRALLAADALLAAALPAGEPWQAFLDRFLGEDRSRYDVRGEIGRGGMGVVLDAWDQRLRRSVALKLLRTDAPPLDASDPRRLARFLQEAQVTSQLEHPGIVPVHEIGVLPDGRVFFAMRKVEGETLARAFARARERSDGWTRERALGVLLRAGEAVAFAHSRDVIHRDLKPQNVMVGSYGQVYVMDWGLSRVGARNEVPSPVSSVRDELPHEAGTPDVRTRHGDQIGTPAYMSPEQAAGDWPHVDARTDVYAIGTMLRELLAGDPRGALEDDEVPDELAAMCHKATAPSPADRYADMRAFNDDLRSYLEGRVVLAHRSDRLTRTVKWVRRNRWLTASLALAFVVAAAGGLVVAWLSGRNEVLARERQRAVLDAELDSSSMHGLWRRVLDGLQRSGELGLIEPPERGLREAQAWLAMGMHQRAGEALAALSTATLTDAQRARQLLLRAQIEQGPGGSPSVAKELLSELDPTALAPSEREYVGGLRATRTVDALEHFERALRLDPLHHGAAQGRVLLLLLLGRHAEAFDRARELEALFPDDPTGYLVEALELALRGEHESSNQVLSSIETRLGLQPGSGLRDPIEFITTFNRVPAEYFWDRSGPTEFLDAFASGRRIVERYRSGAAGQPSGIILPKIEPVARAFEAMARLSDLPEDATQPPELWEEALQGHDEGTLWFFHGISLLNADLGPGQTQADKLRAAAASFENTLHKPCLIPDIRASARFLLGHCYNDLVRDFGDDGSRPAAIAACREFPVDAETEWSHVLLFCNLSLTFGITDEGLRLVNAWLALHPDDAKAQFARAEVLREMGALELALHELEALVGAHPDDEQMRTARDLVLQRLDQRRRGSK